MQEHHHFEETKNTTIMDAPCSQNIEDESFDSNHITYMSSLQWYCQNFERSMESLKSLQRFLGIVPAVDVMFNPDLGEDLESILFVAIDFEFQKGMVGKRCRICKLRKLNVCIKA